MHIDALNAQATHAITTFVLSKYCIITIVCFFNSYKRLRSRL